VQGMSAATWNIVGIVLSLAGVILLFLFGMPFRTRTRGQIHLFAEETDHAALKHEKRHDLLQWLGFALVVAGALFQIVGNLVH
jgi:drug/metabolite transporter (DMT)-like permease